MPDFEATRLAVALTVADLPASLAWYRDVVGFQVDREHERDGRVASVSLRAGNVRLLLNQDDGARGVDRAKGEGFSIFLVTDQDIDELAEGIEARGGSLALPPTTMPWGPRTIRLVDPDGFRIAISSG